MTLSMIFVYVAAGFCYNNFINIKQYIFYQDFTYLQFNFIEIMNNNQLYLFITVQSKPASFVEGT